MKHTRPIVIVNWIDAWANASGYYDTSYTYEGLDMLDIGWLLEENDEGLLLGRTESHETTPGSEPRFRGENFIPWEMVISWEILND